jgi:predicted nucleic acid-binding protein
LALLYLDSSALVKLVRAEPESAALTAFTKDAELISCELALTELPRAVRRAVPDDPSRLLEHAGQVLDAVALLPLHRALLLAAGSFTEQALRALDAIHLAAAIAASPIDAFVSYDERQSGAARLAGFRTVAPGR